MVEVATWLCLKPKPSMVGITPYTSGFGYRAKYIVESAKHVVERGGAEWALKMRDSERDDVRDQLLTLSGVGPKVGIHSFNPNSSLIQELGDEF